MSLPTSPNEIISFLAHHAPNCIIITCDIITCDIITCSWLLKKTPHVHVLHTIHDNVIIGDITQSVISVSVMSWLQHDTHYGVLKGSLYFPGMGHPYSSFSHCNQLVAVGSGAQFIGPPPSLHLWHHNLFSGLEEEISGNVTDSTHYGIVTHYVINSVMSPHALVSYIGSISLCS